MGGKIFKNHRYHQFQSTYIDTNETLMLSSRTYELIFEVNQDNYFQEYEKTN